MDPVQISGYVPGAIGRITELHATFYNENWGFGLYFESKVAAEMSEFLNRFDQSRDGFWVARAGKDILGSVAIDGIKSQTEGAHLRWFIVDPEFQGKGIGRTLIHEAMDFCRATNFKRVYLWTFAGLDAARHLYEAFGFVVSKEHEGRQWGKVVREQRFELIL